MTTETEVANRALQRCGAERILPGSTMWNEDSKNASELRACYDMIRRSELRRNVWRYSIRTERLRAITATTKIIRYPTWASNVTYVANDRVVLNGKSYICLQGGINQTPDARTWDYWTNYFGSDTAELYDAAVTYNYGEQVYDGSDNLYISIAEDNKANAVTVTTKWAPLFIPAWVQFTIYALGQRVTSGGITYVSLQASNQNNSPAASPLWWSVTNPQTLPLASFQVPSRQGSNIFRLPVGFMRLAPQSPKQGSYTPMGAPSASPYTDWDVEGNYIKTQMSSPLDVRFACDIEDPNEMDPMFIDGFTCRLAYEVCETITQSSKKLADLGGAYTKFMSEARAVNGIEIGPIEAPEDSYISLRT